MQLNVSVSTTAGDELIRVVNGHVRHEATEPVRYERVQGHVRLSAPATGEYMPLWALDQMRIHEPAFGADGRLRLLEIEVLEPGLVRVQGVWTAQQHAVAITDTSLAFLGHGRERPLSFMGEGADSVLHFDGPITTALFRVGGGKAAIHVPTMAATRPGRNDPCWCGSGRKYKKCHGA
jgi:hypothetical protein